MSSPCRCDSPMCTECTVRTRVEMDLEFGGGGYSSSQPDTPIGRQVNRALFEHGEERCREFGTGGTTRAQRKARFGPMD